MVNGQGVVCPLTVVHGTDQGSMMAYRGVNPGQGSMDLDNLGVINFSIAFLYSIL